MVASIFAAAQFFGGSSEPAVDYYIATDGNDGNDGSSGSPWLTFAPLITATDAAPNDAVITAYVRTGTYNDVNLSPIGTSVNAGVNLTITIADGTVFDGPTGVDRSWLNMTGGAWFLNILGESGGPSPTWTVQGYDTGTGNGIGMDSAGGATLLVRNCLSQGNVDGWSCHGVNPQSYVYDSVFKSNSKSAASHVHSAGRMYASNCEFWGNPGGSALGIYFETTAASANTDLDNCKFIPTGTVSTERNCDFRGATLNNCQIGTTTFPVNLAGSAEITLFNDCYIHAFWDMNRAATMTQCYGRASIRMRNSALLTTLDHCVFVDGASGQTDGLIFRNFDPGSSARILVLSTVVRGYGTAIGSGYGAADAAYWLAADCNVTNCCLFGNTTNVDADIVTADPTSITNTVTTDPQMPGPFNTVTQLDYVVGAAGPCIGAGIGGTNIGFAATDI